MNHPDETEWKPLTGLPQGAETWHSRVYDDLVSQWRQLHEQSTDIVTKDILSGHDQFHHANGGKTDREGYHPPLVSPRR